MKHDTTDRKLLAALRDRSDRRLHEYAASTGIPKSTLHERLRKLTEAGVRCTPLLAWEHLGFPLRVCFVVPFNEGLQSHPSVNNAMRLAPNLLYLECLFRSLREVEEFRSSVRGGRMFLVIEVLKAEGFIPTPIE